MSTTIEAVYEQGVLKLDRPIDLADGTRVEVTVVAKELTQSTDRRKRTPAEIAGEIAAMPMESSLKGFSGEDHDQILYGWDKPR